MRRDKQTLPLTVEQLHHHSLDPSAQIRALAMPVPYTPLAVANAFLTAYGRVGIEHMKLQKLVYCAHGWWLAYHDDSALLDERPQVWKHGPVFDSLYRVLRNFGRQAIHEPQSANPFAPPPAVDADDENVRALVAWVWGRYGHLTSFALSDLTHRPGTPWSRVASDHNYRVPYNLDIPDDYIRQEFRSIVDRESVTVQTLSPAIGAQDDRRQHA